MTVLSTITGSLANLLTFVQGKWDIQYKIEEKSKDEDLSIFEKFENVVSYLNNTPKLNTGSKWQSIDFDSFVDIQEVGETSITQVPIEKGSFRAVNKVIKPKIIKVTLAKGGIGYGIQEMLSELKQLLPLARYGNLKKTEGLSTDIDNIYNKIVSSVTSLFTEDKKVKKKRNDFPLVFRIITPFDLITNLNLIKIDYSFKRDNGRNMLFIYLTLEEIIEINSGVKSKQFQNPTDTPNVSIGLISAKKG